VAVPAWTFYQFVGKVAYELLKTVVPKQFCAQKLSLPYFCKHTCPGMGPALATHRHLHHASLSALSIQSEDWSHCGFGFPKIDRQPILIPSNAAVFIYSIESDPLHRIQVISKCDNSDFWDLKGDTLTTKCSNENCLNRGFTPRACSQNCRWSRHLEWNEKGRNYKGRIIRPPVQKAGALLGVGFIFLIILVGAIGFEPTTPCAQGRLRAFGELPCFQLVIVQAVGCGLLRLMEPN